MLLERQSCQNDLGSWHVPIRRDGSSWESELSCHRKYGSICARQIASTTSPVLTTSRNLIGFKISWWILSPQNSCLRDVRLTPEKPSIWPGRSQLVYAWIKTMSWQRTWPSSLEARFSLWIYILNLSRCIRKPKWLHWHLRLVHIQQERHKTKGDAFYLRASWGRYTLGLAWLPLSGQRTLSSNFLECPL